MQPWWRSCSSSSQQQCSQVSKASVQDEMHIILGLHLYATARLTAEVSNVYQGSIVSIMPLLHGDTIKHCRGKARSLQSICMHWHPCKVGCLATHINSNWQSGRPQATALSQGTVGISAAVCCQPLFHACLAGPHPLQKAQQECSTSASVYKSVWFDDDGLMRYDGPHTKV